METNLIKLNIGCGSRLIDGFVNIDLAHRGCEPDVVSDVRDLPFEDDYADVVMAIHLVEHFYRWEIVEVMTEWLRVLRPGGEMIIECPDIEKAMLYMVNGVKNEQLTMWPLYGDPSHKDPLMCHKWGYNQETLHDVMRMAGLRDIQRKQAEYHLKERRDMRMVGYK